VIVASWTCASVLQRFGQESQPLTHFENKDLARVGRDHPVAVANEEPDAAQVLFKPGNVMADCAVRKRELLRCPAVAQVARCRFESTERLKGRKNRKHIQSILFTINVNPFGLYERDIGTIHEDWSVSENQSPAHIAHTIVSRAGVWPEK
jgi:hypothetical protein